jgi:hypothetical protein
LIGGGRAGEAARVAAAAPAAAVAVAPASDRDGDGILDPVDACPEQVGVASAEPTRHGCVAPAAPALVTLTKDRIEILQAVAFELGKDVLKPESGALLRQVAAVLAAHPELVKVRVEGHTDQRRRGVKRRCPAAGRGREGLAGPAGRDRRRPPRGGRLRPGEAPGPERQRHRPRQEPARGVPHRRALSGRAAQPSRQGSEARSAATMARVEGERLSV